jgi:hypothetical protein
MDTQALEGVGTIIHLSRVQELLTSDGQQNVNQKYFKVSVQFICTIIQYFIATISSSGYSRLFPLRPLAIMGLGWVINIFTETDQRWK